MTQSGLTFGNSKNTTLKIIVVILIVAILVIVGVLAGLIFVKLGGASTPLKPVECVVLGGDCTTSADCCYSFTCELTDGGKDFLGKCVQNKPVVKPNPNAPDGCPYSRKLEQILEPVRDGDEFERQLQYYEDSREQFLRLVAFRANPKRNNLLSVRELNTLCRRLIEKTTEAVGNHIFPLIIATESQDGLEGVGSTFTLYLEDGSSRTLSPVSEEYEIRKGISHIPLGLFAILAPYFGLGHSSAWVEALAEFRNQIEETLESTLVAASDKNLKMYSDTIRVLTITSDFTHKWLERTKSNEHSIISTVSVQEFEEYSSKIYPYLENNIAIAADLQMRELIPMLKNWKSELGEAKWKEVYAVIPALWPGINPRFQALAAVMSPMQAINQVFILENGGDLNSLRKVLGKIITHRVAAQLIFKSDSHHAKELIFAMAGKQDIMSIEAENVLKKMNIQNR